MEKSGYYSETAIRNLAAIGRVTVNFLWISCLISIINEFTHWFSTYDESLMDYKENFSEIVMISIYISLPLTGIIWIIRSFKLSNKSNQ